MIRSITYHLFAICYAIIPTLAHAHEGFYFPEELPASYLAGLKLDAQVIRGSQISTAIMGTIYQYPLAGQAQLDSEKKWLANATPRTLRWYSEYARAIQETSSCFGGCILKDVYFPTCSAVFVQDPKSAAIYLATAKHCLWYTDSIGENTNPKPVFAKFLDPRTRTIRTLVVETNSSTNHYLPFEAILYSVPKKYWASLVPAKISNRSPINGESVYGLGLPSLQKRSMIGSGVPPYDTKSYDLKVTMGKVIMANRERYSYCAFSNEIEESKPRTWRPQLNCPIESYSRYKYDARQEFNFMLTDTDMTYGMSGSPLFNVKGELIAIGNSILNDQAFNYVADGYAIYSKAENLKILLDRERK